MMNTENSNNTLNLVTVKKAVYSWSIRFREAGYANEQLARLSQEYFEDLQSEGVTERQFEAAANSARKRCRFFPKMCDILQAVQEYRERPPQPKGGIEQIESTSSRHDLTPEEVERNKARLKTITDMLAGKLSADEAVRAVEAQTHIEEFKQ
jgi:hypothetical protein